MAGKQKSMLTPQVIKDGLAYILCGRLRIKNAHLPPANHLIPQDFIGICVATNDNPATDTYIINQLNSLGMRKVRLDFTYPDIDGAAERFLQALLAADFQVCLHVFPPFEAAKLMKTATEQNQWKAFLEAILHRYATRLYQVEVGSTINRKRWAGFTPEGFLAAWEIAFHAIKAQQVTLVGPNIQDFEPLYNISYLKHFAQRHCLPDVHSNNLFVERVSEPERFDHRILRHRWTTLFKVNLVKKARLLQKLGQDFGVAQFMSPAAFWAIYRIERILVNGEQKQADYLTRYFVLLAASGALQQANWGALICHREGLISDGLSDAEYPAVERIHHYRSADGLTSNYRPLPSFKAMQAIIDCLRGSRYERAIATANGLEIHQFTQPNRQFHVAWAINGKAAFLNKIYTENTLKAATIFGLDGELLKQHTDLVNETPIYLVWDNQANIETLPNPKLEAGLAIYRHTDQGEYVAFNLAGWQGLMLAQDRVSAATLAAAIDPRSLQSPDKDQTLRHARNAIWTIADPRDINKKLTVKQPVKMYAHKRWLDRNKASKARRSWSGAMELLRRGINTAMPVAFFEKNDDLSLKQNFYICEYVVADFNIGQTFSAFARGDSQYAGLEAETVYKQFAQFCHIMHSRGIYFRDLSGGNILANIEGAKLRFTLIDTARLRSFNYPVAMVYRIADLTRACHKLHWAGRKRFMQIYLGLSGNRFSWQHQLQFHLYDLKVKLKRTIGRKGMRRLLKAIKS